ncbi:MAG: HugZ family protein [Leptolyngbyaceae cyanobacterium SM1_1_3]|nr:HugZ family protein [Leptolyngbyaceae cyanobacterium SM1_1_3]NJN03254.1 HugZ family protein [Leptolyngbyaceae cyanobacterium RM1_1_2]NJO11212.1 HugZ family protein [Leptolyngbyaceae cyanobacterium SL_1_1]
MSQLESVLAAYQRFPSEVQSLMLSTLNADGSPHASYAPFIVNEQHCFFVFTSGLSSHTQNLAERTQASVLLIADESQTSQIFARQRLSYHCTAELLPKDNSRWTQICDRFQQRFGNIIEMLRSLPDFCIFQLTPFGGSFIMGFGAAYEVDPDNLDNLIPMQGGKS